jgi:exodeoxyribonuclease-5
VIGEGSTSDTILVTGYAGTGKTTVVRALVEALPLFNFRFVLLAPTGRAAKVLASYSSRKAFTIHKIIYRQVADPESSRLKFELRKNYRKRTVYIIDEASMISDSSTDTGGRGLLDDVVRYVFADESNKLILIGDQAQLPPVGSSGSPALVSELLKTRYGLQVRQVRLTEVVRQAQGSGILHNATGLREVLSAGRTDILFHTGKYKDIYGIGREKMEDGLRYAYNKYGIENTIIVCRSNWQAVQYNQFIRRNILFHEDELDAGDVLMVVRNNYFYLDPESDAGFVANGDFMEVRKIVRFEEMHGFRFATLDLQMVDYPHMPPFRAKVMLDTLHSTSPSLSREDSVRLYAEVLKDYSDITTRKARTEALQADEYLNALQVKYAYALTCHKSQGGQWKIVFLDQGIADPSQVDTDYIRWLYTGVTRAEQELYLVNFSPDFMAD